MIPPPGAAFFHHHSAAVDKNDDLEENRDLRYGHKVCYYMRYGCVMMCAIGMRGSDGDAWERRSWGILGGEKTGVGQV